MNLDKCHVAHTSIKIHIFITPENSLVPPFPVNPVITILITITTD